MIPLAAPALGEAELERIAEVFERGRLARGPEVDAFETEFAAFCDVDHGIATATGTAALHAAFESLDLGPGDRIATSPFSFVASAHAIRWCGAEPVFVDVRDDTYNIDLHALEGRLRNGDRIDAVLAVHLFGLPCELSFLRELADEYDFAVVEDAAQAHGATCEGRPVGSFGDAACFSFFASKNMTTGEGGMVVTDRSEVAARARQFVDHGRTEEGFASLGHNLCLSDVAAAIGRAQLEKLPEFTDARRTNARQLTAGLRETPVVTPTEPADRRHVYHQYTVRTEDRVGLRAQLREQGIQTGVYYDRPIPDHPAYADHDPSLPTTDELKHEVVSLPVHQGLSAADRDRVVTAVQEYFSSG